MAQSSFDIVSEYDTSEVIHAFDQANREISNRYDFRGTPAELAWLDQNKTGLKVTGNNEWQIDQILDIFRKKLASRNQSQKILDTSKDPAKSHLKIVKEIPFKQGLNQDKAKRINKLIRDKYPKIKAQIQGDSVRVVGKSKDDLQAVIKLVQSEDFDFPVKFTNYR